MKCNSLKLKKQAKCEHNLWIRVPYWVGMWECRECGKRSLFTHDPNVIHAAEFTPDEQKIIDRMMK